MQYEKISLREKLSYGLGSLGNNMIYGLMASYLLVFYTESFGIAAAAAAGILFFPKIWDAMNDPIMGLLVDNTSSRWGKFRPYLLFVPFIMAVMVVLCFSSPNLSQSGKIIFGYATFTLWGMSFTAMDIPFWSMSAVITQDPDQRNTIVMIPRTLATLGNILVVIITLPLVSFLGKGNASQGWFRVALLYSVICIIMTLTCFFNVKERHVPQQKEKQTIKGLWEQLKANKPLRQIILSMLIFELIFALKMILPFYYIKCNYNLDPEKFVPLFVGGYAIVNILGSVISPFISKKFGKKNAAIYGGVLIGITSIGLFFGGYHGYFHLIFWSALGALGDGIANIARMSMLVDTVEYGEYATGKRSEGFIFSTNILKTKIASAVGGSLGALTLGIFGYNSVLAQQSVQTMNGIHLSFSLLPGILALVSLLPLIKYSLTEDKYNDIVSELRKNEG